MAPAVQLRQKAIAMDRALELVESGEIKQQDLAIFWYICTSLDSETGEAIRRYETIAEACGISRRTAIRAVDRLKAVGLLVSRPRSYKETNGDLANAYSLGDAAIPTRPVSWMSLGECHERHCISSHSLHIPNGNQHATKNFDDSSSTGHATADPTDQVDDVDWDELAWWLAKAARLEKRYGFGAVDLASDDLERLREAKGDKALLQAIQIAKAKGLYGEPLEDFLRRPGPIVGSRCDGAEIGRSSTWHLTPTKRVATCSNFRGSEFRGKSDTIALFAIFPWGLKTNCPQSKQEGAANTDGSFLGTFEPRGTRHRGKSAKVALLDANIQI